MDDNKMYLNKITEIMEYFLTYFTIGKHIFSSIEYVKALLHLMSAFNSSTIWLNWNPYILFMKAIYVTLSLFSMVLYLLNAIYYTQKNVLSRVIFYSLALCSCIVLYLVLKELSFVQPVNSKELAFTWLSCCCYGREARQRRKKPLSQSLTHFHFHSRSLSFLPHSLVLSASEPSWLEIQMIWEI